MSLNVNINASYTLSTQNGVFNCIPNFEIDLTVDAHQNLSNSNPVTSAEWQGKTVKISNISRSELSVMSSFAEITNCKTKSICASGDLYIHDCPEEIDSVIAGGDVILYKWSVINSIETKGDVHLVIHGYEGRKVFQKVRALGSINTIFLTSGRYRAPVINVNRNENGIMSGEAEITLS